MFVFQHFIIFNILLLFIIFYYWYTEIKWIRFVFMLCDLAKLLSLINCFYKFLRDSFGVLYRFPIFIIYLFLYLDLLLTGTFRIILKIVNYIHWQEETFFFPPLKEEMIQCFISQQNVSWRFFVFFFFVLLCRCPLSNWGWCLFSSWSYKRMLNSVKHFFCIYLDYVFFLFW